MHLCVTSGGVSDLNRVQYQTTGFTYLFFFQIFPEIGIILQLFLYHDFLWHGLETVYLVLGASTVLRITPKMSLCECKLEKLDQFSCYLHKLKPNDGLLHLYIMT